MGWIDWLFNVPSGLKYIQHREQTRNTEGV
jgi:hypothetical protein